jgi:hypothetical protein
VARYAKVDVRIWDDDKVKAMTPIPPCGQGLWIRLLVSRHRSAVPGLLCVGEAALAEEFGWSLEDFRKAFQEAKGEGLVKADWKARVVWLPKAWKFNSPESPNVVRSWRIPWDETPECSLKAEVYQILKAFAQGLKEGFRKAFAESCRMPSPNQEQEPEQEPEQEQEGKSPPAKPPGCKCSGEACLSPTLCDVSKVEAIAKAAVEYLAKPREKIRPRTADTLEHCLRVAVENAQPQNGRWLPGRFAAKDADECIRKLGDIEAALPELERKIELFAKDPDMQPWTVAKFADKFNAIGLPRLEFGRSPDVHPKRMQARY